MDGMKPKDKVRTNLSLERKMRDMLRAVAAGRSRVQGKRVTETEIVEQLIALHLAAEAAAYVAQSVKS